MNHWTNRQDGVAQVFNLSYRRLAVGRVSARPSAVSFVNAPQDAILRHGRLKIWATRCGISGLALTAALVLVGLASTCFAAQQADLTSVTLQVGFTKAAFLGVNQNDAEAAFRAFTEIVGKKRGYSLKPQTRVFDSLTELETATRKGEIVMIILDTWDYLSLQNPEVMEPQFAPVEQGMLFKRYLLLTRRGSGLNKLTDLRGKDGVILENANVSLGRQWFESLLLENQLGTPKAFFGSVEIVGKASTAVLPVFFEKKQACVVDEPAFDVMRELNPQVGKVLQAVVTSDAYLDGMIAFSRSGWVSAQHKEDLYRGLAELHLEPDGQQILALFKTTRLLPFKDSYLDAVRELRSKCERLRGENRP